MWGCSRRVFVCGTTGTKVGRSGNASLGAGKKALHQGKPVVTRILLLARESRLYPPTTLLPSSPALTPVPALATTPLGRRAFRASFYTHGVQFGCI